MLSTESNLQICHLIQDSDKTNVYWRVCFFFCIHLGSIQKGQYCCTFSVFVSGNFTHFLQCLNSPFLNLVLSHCGCECFMQQPVIGLRTSSRAKWKALPSQQDDKRVSSPGGHRGWISHSWTLHKGKQGLWKRLIFGTTWCKPESPKPNFISWSLPNQETSIIEYLVSSRVSCTLIPVVSLLCRLGSAKYELIFAKKFSIPNRTLVSPRFKDIWLFWSRNKTVFNSATPLTEKTPVSIQNRQVVMHQTLESICVQLGPACVHHTSVSYKIWQVCFLPSDLGGSSPTGRLACSQTVESIQLLYLALSQHRGKSSPADQDEWVSKLRLIVSYRLLTPFSSGS